MIKLISDSRVGHPLTFRSEKLIASMPGQNWVRISTLVCCCCRIA